MWLATVFRAAAVRPSFRASWGDGAARIRSHTSPSEREVLGLVAEGMSNRAISGRLYVTERTVEAHITQIFQKLHLAGSSDQHRRVLAVLASLRS